MPPDAAPMLGRLILSFGIVLVVVGLVLVLGARLPGFIGRLPGDLSWSRGPVRLYVPLGTSVLLSLVLTILYWLVSWLRR